MKARSAELMKDLFSHTDARFLLVSFNNEGFVGPAEMRALQTWATCIWLILLLQVQTGNH